MACGWGRLEAPVEPEKLKELIRKKSLVGVPRLKIFASGSFLDDAQFPREFRKWFADYVKKQGVKELIFESRPEFVTDESLKDFEGVRLTVAIGLESSSDEVLKGYGKGFTSADYAKAAELLRKKGFGVRTYLMVNMPGSTKASLDKSVEFALKYSDSVVLINTFPHAKAPLFDSWIDGKWKPYGAADFEAAVKKWKSNPKIETDLQNYMFVPKFPKEKQKPIRGAMRENLEHPFYNVWQDYFQRFYEPPKGKDILLFLPCSFQKPYFASQTHKSIDAALRKTPVYNKIHKVVVSNPGVIPLEFCDYYPFMAYDWPEWEETPEVKKAYVDVTRERVRQYLEAQAPRYKRIYAYLKYTETWAAVEAAAKELGITIENLLDRETYEKIKDAKNPIISEEALACLQKLK
jgi:hypothetical protein